ncbi:MAG: hypothetical protein ACI8TX_003462 [Hyphomicrobiaceae bacterium]|jgi:hypothetical protein
MSRKLVISQIASLAVWSTVGAETAQGLFATAYLTATGAIEQIVAPASTSLLSEVLVGVVEIVTSLLR